MDTGTIQRAKKDDCQRFVIRLSLAGEEKLKSLRKKARGRRQAVLFPKRFQAVLSGERGIEFC
jgi:hypothetical protein